MCERQSIRSGTIPIDQNPLPENPDSPIAALKNAPIGGVPAKTRNWASWLPLILWAAILFALSSIPGTQIPNVGISFADKIVHACVYGIFGALCYRALSRTTGLGPGRAVWLVALVALLYGISDEIHQMFVPMRSSELLDVLADVTGGTLGAVVARWLMRVPARG